MSSPQSNANGTSQLPSQPAFSTPLSQPAPIWFGPSMNPQPGGHFIPYPPITPQTRPPESTNNQTTQFIPPQQQQQNLYPMPRPPPRVSSGGQQSYPPPFPGPFFQQQPNQMPPGYRPPPWAYYPPGTTNGMPLMMPPNTINPLATAPTGDGGISTALQPLSFNTIQPHLPRTTSTSSYSSTYARASSARSSYTSNNPLPKKPSPNNNTTIKGGALTMLPPSPSKAMLQRVNSASSSNTTTGNISVKRPPRRSSGRSAVVSRGMNINNRPPSSSPPTRSPSINSSLQLSARQPSGSPILWEGINTTNPSARHSRTASRAGSARSSPSVAGSTLPDEADNIKVVVRIRPLNDTERYYGDLDAVSVDPFDSRMLKVSVPGANGMLVNRTFAFHSCLGPETEQKDVIEQCGVPHLLDAVLDGYNATILAYGQTGSGKTFTISGAEDDVNITDSEGNHLDNEFAGIIPRSVAYLFEQLAKRQGIASSSPPPNTTSDNQSNTNDENSPGNTTTDATPDATPTADPAAAGIQGDGCVYRVKVSYCEIYNEALYDLLHFDQRQLQIRWDAVKGFWAPELHAQECHSLEDVMQMVRIGQKHRRVGAHALNLESSRSHSVLSIYVEATPMHQDDHDYGTTRIGKACFVDLAGSERLKDSGSSGSTLRETASINCSLFMLGKVISALASGAKGARVPYRESKLTKLLMDSLGGSAMALFIACCSPSSAHADETLHTLGYASRAKNIKNSPAVQVDPKEAALIALRREVRLLRMENTYLRDQLFRAHNPPLSTTNNPKNSLLGSDNNASTTSLTAANINTTVSGGVESPGTLPGQSAFLPIPAIDSALRSNEDGSSILNLDGGDENSSKSDVEDVKVRLVDAQRLLVSMANENSRLAAENERLRAGTALVAGDYSGALDEVDWLKSKLAALEASLVENTSTNVGTSLIPSDGKISPPPAAVLASTANLLPVEQAPEPQQQSEISSSCIEGVMPDT